ncbi:MAG: hypothetical protein CMH56_08575 [Myxococcales bacterium]|nr:hypothetical protein [Myxococcales bacterium]|tara:strand:+ start:1191 stop:1715 length:525 start_codon:yes stop_codon:yes gene_type:complete
MNVLLYIAIGLVCQTVWTFIAGAMSLEVQPLPLFILFAYALLVLPLGSRLLVAMVVGWLMDLHGGGQFGFHVITCSFLALWGAWYQRNLAFLKSSLFPFWVMGLYFSALALLGVLMWPFPNAHNPFSFFEWVAAGFWHGIWAVVFYPLYGFCSKALALESEEAVGAHEGWAHGR